MVSFEDSSAVLRENDFSLLHEKLPGGQRPPQRDSLTCQGQNLQQAATTPSAFLSARVTCFSNEKTWRRVNFLLKYHYWT